MPALIISRLTLHEAQRRRLLWVALIMGVLFLTVFGIAFHYIRADLLRFPVPERQEHFVYAMLLTAGLYATNLLVTIVTVLISVTTISGEIESHVIDAIVTKPIPRWQIVAGKWLAYALMAVVYLLFLTGGLMLIVYFQSGYHFDDIGRGLLMMALAALLILTLSIAGGTRLTTLANGVMTFMFFAVAFLGGFVEQIGSLFRNEAAVNIGILTSLLMPADALWKKALAFFQPPEFSGSINAGPFAVTAEPSNLMIVYAIGYMAILLGFALWSFSRRDL